MAVTRARNQGTGIGVELLAALLSSGAKSNSGGGMAKSNQNKTTPSTIEEVQSEVAEKTLRKKLTQQAEEAFDTAGPMALFSSIIPQSSGDQSFGQLDIGKILAGAQPAIEQNQNNQLLSQIKQQPVQQQSNPNFNNVQLDSPQGILGKLFQQAGITQNPDGGFTVKPGGIFSTASAEGLAREIGAVQKIAGLEPMQESERRKLQQQQEIKQQEIASKFINDIVVDKPLSSADSNTLGFINSAVDASTQLLDIFQYDPQTGTIGNPNALRDFNPKSSSGQNITRLINQLKNDLLRKESGAAITKDDQDFIKKITPRDKSLIENPETAVNKLVSIANKLNAQKKLMQPNADQKDKIKFLKAKGVSETEIYQAIQQGMF